MSSPQHSAFCVCRSKPMAPGRVRPAYQARGNKSKKGTNMNKLLLVASATVAIMATSPASAQVRGDYGYGDFGYTDYSPMSNRAKLREPSPRVQSGWYVGRDPDR